LINIIDRNIKNERKIMKEIKTYEMMINQLLNTKFESERGYSYPELLNFLNSFQIYYRDCYLKKESLEKEINIKNKTFNDLEYRITYLDNLLKDMEKANNIYLNKIQQKLSIWERITGKINSENVFK
jgi:hypothetical protein